MSRSSQLCPRCGETVTEPVDERGRCVRCHLDAIEPVDIPGSIEVLRCGQCASLAVEGDWEDHDGDLLDLAVDHLTGSIRVHRSVDAVDWAVREEPIDDNHRTLRLTFQLTIGEQTVTHERETTLAVIDTTCPRCSRIAGDEFGAIVQLRADGRTPTDGERRRARAAVAHVLDDRVDRGDREAFLTTVDERADGLDFRLSTPRLGNQIATRIRDRLGGRIETSKTLVTTDGDGREVYRVTYAVRLPRLRPGDIVTFDGGVGLVESGGPGITVYDLATGDRSTREASQLEGPETSVDAAEEATIVAPLDDRSVQVLHPRTSETVTVARHDAVDLSGESVPVVEVGDRLYLLPRDVG